MQKELVHLLFSFTFFCLLTTNTYAANTGKYASNLKFIPIPSSILLQSPNQKIPDRKTKCVIKTHINIKQNVIFGAKLKPV